MPLLKKLLLGTGAAVAGLGAFVATKPKPAPFHVRVPPVEMKIAGYNIFPAFRFGMSILPEQIRKKVIAQLDAPKPNEIKDRLVTS